MNPVFNEYIEFLKDNGVEYKLEEGYYWLDRQIVRCFDKEGNQHKILRVYTDDDLNITHKLYKQKKFKIESWEETIDRDIDKLKLLESRSKDLIRKSLEKL